MMGDEKEEYYEHVNYRELLKMQPEDFYLHLPLQLPFLKWFFEVRLQLLLMTNMYPNYFGLRHRFEPQAQWFSDWVFLNHYQFDYQADKKWKPSLLDRLRYQWLMRQGYMKEHKNYLELVDRKENKKVSVHERKFLRQYAGCRYWSYFDAEREDNLAFFRMGIDSDEQLKSEDMPLFPNIAFSFYDDPRLAYWQNNVMQTEFIPPVQSWWTKRKAKKVIAKKWSKDEKVIYADIRLLFNQDTTKIHDLEFLLHVFDAHSGQPEDEKEKELYDELFALYRIEITHIAQMMHFPELEKLNISTPRKALNPLYVAYKKRWFHKNPVKDFEKLFHGVSEEEYQEIVNQQYKHFEKTKRPKSQKKNSISKMKKLNDLLIKISIQK